MLMAILSVNLLPRVITFPNPDIENMIIAQSLSTPSKPRKYLITNEVTTNFIDLLYVPIDCTLIRVSISGFGTFKIYNYFYYGNIVK